MELLLGAALFTIFLGLCVLVLNKSERLGCLFLTAAFLVPTVVILWIHSQPLEVKGPYLYPEFRGKEVFVTEEQFPPWGRNYFGEYHAMEEPKCVFLDDLKFVQFQSGGRYSRSYSVTIFQMSNGDLIIVPYAPINLKRGFFLNEEGSPSYIGPFEDGCPQGVTWE